MDTHRDDFDLFPARDIIPVVLDAENADKSDYGVVRELNR